MLAVSLARQSRAKDDQDDSVSIAFQHRVNRDEAKRRDDEITVEFEDVDVSGHGDSRAKRAGLHAMLAYLKQHPQVRRVYIYNVSRLARDTYFFLELYRSLTALKPPVELRSASESIEDPTIMIMIAAMAERERTTLSNNVAYSVREQAQRGLVTQQVPIGYTRRDGVLYPDANAETVRRIFRDYTGGQSTFAIAERLQQSGIPSPYGKAAWTSKTIRRLLSRRTYIGEIEISETRDPSGRIRPHLITQGQHEPLIDRATWDLAQRLLSDRSWSRRKDGRVEPWLTKHAHCVHCGRRVYFGVKSRQTPSGELRWYAKCATAQLASDKRIANTCPGQASCDLHTIEPVARESLWHRLQSIASADDAHARALAITSATSDQTRRQLEERLAHHRDRAAELFQMRIGREIGPDEFMAARDIEESAIAAITADLAALPAPLPLMAFRDAHAVLIDAAAFIRTWSDDDLRRVVSLIGATAYLDLGAKSVSWAFVEPYETLLVRGTI